MNDQNKISQKLLSANQSNNTESVIALIEQGFDIHAKNEHGQTLLHISSYYGNIDIALVLIANGADVNSKDKNKSAPLHLASLHGNADTVIALLGKGANIHANDEWGQTPLHLAALSECTDTVLALLSKGADIHAKDNHGNTPLYQASHHGRTEISLFFIAYGANASEADREPLKTLTMHQAAAKFGLTDRLMMLLRDHTSDLLEDSPDVLVKLAKRHRHMETAAAIQSFMAAQALDFVVGKCYRAASPS